MKIAEAGKIYGKITLQPGGSTAEMLENFLDRKPSTETFFAMFEACHDSGVRRDCCPYH
jgi:hypothetical protein